MGSTRLVIASRNQHKVQELRKMLEGLDYEVVSVDQVGDFPDVVEDGTTFQQNAAKKARETARLTNCLSLADDSGLEVDYLDGQPGVYSARFAGEPSDDAKNNARLLALLEDVPEESRRAQFRCVMALADPNGGQVQICEGICQGVIGHHPRGSHGFGYDPLFIVPEFGQTFAELGEDTKNAISHRGKAMVEMKKVLEARLM